jgi:hypothetical protein
MEDIGVDSDWQEMVCRGWVALPVPIRTTVGESIVVQNDLAHLSVQLHGNGRSNTYNSDVAGPCAKECVRENPLADGSVSRSDKWVWGGAIGYGDCCDITRACQENKGGRKPRRDIADVLVEEV